MITVSEAVKDVLKKNYSIVTKTGGTIEYNLNNMVDKITAKSNGSDHVLSNAFKNLFPIDSIYSTFRPLNPGIKYYIYTSETSPGVQTDTPPNSFSNPRSKAPTKPTRLYYPGTDTSYKYWVGPKNSNINVSLEYFDNATVPAPKLLPCNKIVARFETSHDIPTSWTIVGTKSDNTTVSTSGTSLSSSGEAIIYYNGTSWSTTEPTSFTSTQSFKKISLTATNSNTGKFLGLIELSPRWIVDISNDIQAFNISRETNLDVDSILPVGTLSASLLEIQITKFNQDDNTIMEYNRDSAIDNSKIYLTKNAIVNPYIIINDGVNDIKISQGKYYMADYSLSEFGSSVIRALDSTKILQDTLCPLILITGYGDSQKDYPITAIIVRLLDSIGYSNYNINVKKDNTGKITDTSIPTLKYFWTTEGQTVWECLQELCRDSQINIFVDHNDVLQVCSRDFIYDNSRSDQWTFTNQEITENGTLKYIPNIISLNKQEKNAGNSVKIIWSPPGVGENVTGQSNPLWAPAGPIGLFAGTLVTELDNNGGLKEVTGNKFININSQSVTQIAENVLNPFSVVPETFNGYFLIDAEVIEFEGIEYQYKTSASNTTVVVIKNGTEFSNYTDVITTQDDVIPFKPTGRYLIKKRGALGTTPAAHAAAKDAANGKIKSTQVIDLQTVTDDADLIGDKKSYYSTAANKWNQSSKTVNKAFYAITNFDKSKVTYTSSLVEFPSIVTTNKPGYYSMGTRLFFDNEFDTLISGEKTGASVGGLTIFAGEKGKTGYHIIVMSTIAAQTGNDIRILKTDPTGKTTNLLTTQTTAANTFAGVYAAETYNIDVIVKSVYNSGGTLTANRITVWINGFRIDATDSSSPLVSPSNRVGLLCGQGICYFDYVYGLNLKQDDPNSNIDYGTLYGRSSYIYKGVYSDDLISLLFGDPIYSAGETESDRAKSLVDFGAVAREIRQDKIRYDSENPGVPLYATTGGNLSATLLASKIQPYTAETYVLNNTSETISLDNGEGVTFRVIGNEIGRGAPVEYSTDTPDTRTKKFPVQFESTWIQNREDAKALADWIASTQLNKGQSVEMEVFGNPIIYPGDIIRINYPLQDLSPTDKKYIITSVSLNFQEGINTRISCRSL